MSKTRLSASIIVLASGLTSAAAAESVPLIAQQPAQPLPAPADPAAPPPAPGQPPPLAPSPLEGQPQEPAPLAPSPLAPAELEPAPPPVVYEPPPPPTPMRHERRGRAGHFGLGATWNLGFPLGSMTDHTGKVSGVGFELLGKYWVHSHVTIGIDVDWQTFVHSRPRTTYQLDDGAGAITATVYNATQVGAIRGGADFFFLDEGMLLPFAGVNIGYGWSTFQTDVADLELFDNEDSVVLGAELGTAVAFGRDAPLFLLFGRYSIQPAAEFLNTVDDIQTITVQVGLMSP